MNPNLDDFVKNYSLTRDPKVISIFCIWSCAFNMPTQIFFIIMTQVWVLPHSLAVPNLPPENFTRLCHHTSEKFTATDWENLFALKFWKCHCWMGEFLYQGWWVSTIGFWKGTFNIIIKHISNIHTSISAVICYLCVLCPLHIKIPKVIK